MSSGRRPLTIAGVLALTVVMLCATAAAAQAAPEWVIEGATHTELGIESETVSDAGGAWTIEVPKLGLTLKCTGQTGMGTISPAGKGSATVELTGCTVSPGGETCTVVTPIKFSLKTELVAAGESIYEKVAGSGETMATIGFSGKGCVLPKSVKITGSAAASVGKEESTQTLTFSGAAATETKAQLFWGVSTATLSGTTKLKLSGANTGKALGAVLVNTALCSESEVSCAAANTFAPNNEFEAKPDMTTIDFTQGGTNFSCTSGILLGRNMAERDEPLGMTFSEWGFGGCNNQCAIFGLNIEGVAVLRANPLSAGNGRLTLLKPLIETKCEGDWCRFEKPTAVLKFEGGEPAKIKPEAVPLSLKKIIEGTCPATLTWTATYRVFGLVKVYVTR
jgi:hypothetical protein